MTRSSIVLLAGLLGLGAVGCAGKGRNSKDSQVVAVVNHQEITYSQLNQSLQTMDMTSVTPEVTKQTVDSLVSEELLVEGALKHRLDRDPAVMQAIDTARRQVLGRYFAERVLYPSQSVTKREALDFYKSNPILFADRKRFQLKTFSFPTSDLADGLQAELDQARSVTEVRDLLDKHDVRYAAQATALSADQLPVHELPAFSRAAVGDVMLAQQDSLTTLLMFVAAIDDDNPLSFERARPFIEVYLTNIRNGNSIAEYLKQARALATISYGATPAATKPVLETSLGGREPGRQPGERIGIQPGISAH